MWPISEKTMKRDLKERNREREEKMTKNRQRNDKENKKVKRKIAADKKRCNKSIILWANGLVEHAI